MNKQLAIYVLFMGASTFVLGYFLGRKVEARLSMPVLYIPEGIIFEENVFKTHAPVNHRPIKRVKSC